MIEKLFLMTATVKREYRWFRVTRDGAAEVPAGDDSVLPLAREMSLYTRRETCSLVMFYARREGRWGVYLGTLPSTRQDHFGRVITTTLCALFDGPDEARAFALNALGSLIAPHADTSALTEAVRVSMKEADGGDDLLAYVERMAQPLGADGNAPAASPAPLAGNYPRHLGRVGDDLRGADLRALVSGALDDARDVLPVVVVARTVDVQRLRGVWRALTDLAEVPEMEPNKKKAPPETGSAPYAAGSSRPLPREEVYVGVAIATLAAVAYVIYRLLRR